MASDITNTPVDNPLEDLHAARKQVKRTALFHNRRQEELRDFKLKDVFDKLNMDAADFQEWLKRMGLLTIDEAPMIPEATFIALLSRFQYACYTLVGDSKQLPPYASTTSPRLWLSAHSLAHRRGNAPVCTIRTVYRPHAGLMRLNSKFFYDDALRCGTPVELRRNLLSRMKLTNPEIPLAVVNVRGHAVRSVAGSYSNDIEANAVRVLLCLLKAKGVRAEDIMVTVATVDSAQGAEKSIVIVCTTRTHIDKDANHSFFADPNCLNVALSRARAGMFVIGCLSSLKVIPLWEQIITWCQLQ
uniref:AAA_12 domain-containing protein n=1 Tax=Heligmosomoides polygyrus TaxID=6339 RepID=A0A183GKM0_HELPZ